jgi:hypothetical protein
MRRSIGYYMGIRLSRTPGLRINVAVARFCLVLAIAACSGLSWVPASALGEEPEEMQIEISKIGLGKEVVITQGAMEWFMRVEVTPENTVVVRQEKQGERYLVDESETHDRSMTAAEVDGAITDFINHVKVKRQKP